ncbi:hypothetical protein JCM9279_006706 [Rhodotorula babjevae]
MQRTCTRCAQQLTARPLASLVASTSSSPAPSARLAVRSVAGPPRAQQLGQARRLHTAPHAPLFASVRPRPSSSPSLLIGATRSPARRTIVCPAEPPPSPSDDFEPVEDDLPAGQHLAMTLTPSAIRQILRAQAAASNPALALRLAVESGGCHGYQYKMQVTATRDQDDYLFRARDAAVGEGEALLVVDAASLPLVNGATVDYATELIGSAFKIKDNPQSKDAGCGCGVSWELKDLTL